MTSLHAVVEPLRLPARRSQMIGFSLYMIKTVFNGRREFSQPGQMFRRRFL